MRVAVVGTGISGLTAAWLLRDAHDVALLEAEERLGGHTHTHQIEVEGKPLSVDTGFIVYNDRNYPTFTRLLAELGVTGTPTAMSFSVVNRNSDIRYNGHDLSTLFAYRPNLANPDFYRMLRDILRFNRLGLRLLALHGPGPTLAQHLRDGRYGAAFVRDYLAPMAASIWSVPTETMGAFPAKRVVEFFRNHGLTSLGDRPEWYCVDGGSSRYVERIVTGLKTPPRIGTPVRRIRRGEQVEITTDAGRETFDAVVLACHSDQALALLADPTPAEREVLGAIRYQANDVVLHTDAAFLPELPALRASWNYLVGEGREAEGATVTYWMNQLQHLEVDTPVLVTLNQTEEIDETKVIRRLSYSHPIFDAPAVSAQGRRSEISGVNGTWYCGAYWRYGFHEDGCLSAAEVVRAMGGAW